MDISSMYGNHHPHHSNAYHSGAAGVQDMTTVAAANAYPNAYFSNSSVMAHGALHHQQNHHVNSGYTAYDGSSPSYYQQQHQPQQPQQLTPPPSQPSVQSQPLYSHSHSHLFSPTAAEYGITTSNTLSAATPSHPSNASHSPSEAVYYENESVHAYYATAAVATVPPASTNSPVTAANVSAHSAQNVPMDPAIISSENGLSYTNLDCLYNQNSPHQHSTSSTYMPPEEKYASVLHSQYNMDDTMMHLTVSANNTQNQQHSPQLWSHQHHMAAASYASPLDPSGLPMDSYNINPHLHGHGMPQHLPAHSQGNPQLGGQQQSMLQHHSPPTTACVIGQNSRSQSVVSPGGTTTSTTSTSSVTSTSSTNATGGTNNSSLAKSPSHGNNLPTYKWMQLKRNVPKPQG